MNRRSFVHRASITAAGFGILRELQACAPAAVQAPVPVPLPEILPGTFTELRDRYFVDHLARNPVTSTYLGGDGYSPLLSDSNTRLRDYSSAALEGELKFYKSLRFSIGQIAAATLVSAADRADQQFMTAQLDFLIHQIGDLRYHERSIDTYVAEPFRGVDWQIQQMPEIPGGLLGNEADWLYVVTRALAVPVYLETAKANLLAGKKAGNLPDKRMVQRDGINGSRANSEYFRTTLPKTAQQFLGSRPFAPAMQTQILAAGTAAANAYDQFAIFLASTYDLNEVGDRYAAGEREYEWRVHNVLRDPRSAAELYEYGASQVALFTGKIIDVAREFATT